MTALPRNTQSPSTGRYPIPAERGYIKSRKAPLPPSSAPAPTPIPLPRREVVCIVDANADGNPPKMHLNQPTPPTLSSQEGHDDDEANAIRTTQPVSQYFSDRDSDWCSSASSTTSSNGRSFLDKKQGFGNRPALYVSPKDRLKTSTFPDNGDQQVLR